MVLIISLKSSTALNYNLLRAIMKYRHYYRCLYDIHIYLTEYAHLRLLLITYTLHLEHRHIEHF